MCNVEIVAIKIVVIKLPKYFQSALCSKPVPIVILRILPTMAPFTKKESTL
ncbi:hypothetical protein S7335_197 [Synechococcus sp. PCC 7335]|nr:hypothetical protein S7335_197 [Synechococcus sp. PCC 7335]